MLKNEAKIDPKNRPTLTLKFYGDSNLKIKSVKLLLWFQTKKDNIFQRYSF